MTYVWIYNIVSIRPNLRNKSRRQTITIISKITKVRFYPTNKNDVLMIARPETTGNCKLVGYLFRRYIQYLTFSE